jgi:hypothetical protein
MNTTKKIWAFLIFIMLLCLAACTPVEEPNTASISGGVFFDCNKDGECEEDEKGIGGMCVRLYSGGCGGDMIQNHTSNEEGEFTFTNLAQGKYCVIADFDLLTCGFAGNHPTTSFSRHVTLESGMNAELEWFGFGNLSGDEEAVEEVVDEETFD